MAAHWGRQLPCGWNIYSMKVELCNLAIMDVNVIQFEQRKFLDVFKWIAFSSDAFSTSMTVRSSSSGFVQKGTWRIFRNLCYVLDAGLNGRITNRESYVERITEIMYICKSVLIMVYHRFEHENSLIEISCFMQDIGANWVQLNGPISIWISLSVLCLSLTRFAS